MIAGPIKSDIFIECGGVKRRKPRINTRKKTEALFIFGKGLILLFP